MHSNLGNMNPWIRASIETVGAFKLLFSFLCTQVKQFDDERGSPSSYAPSKGTVRITPHPESNRMSENMVSLWAKKEREESEAKFSTDREY